MSEAGTASINILCPSCLATNRLPAARLAQSPRCGSCHKPLFDGHPANVDEATLARHLRSNAIQVLLDVWAPWCGPCVAMAPMFERAATLLEPHVRLLKLNADTAPDFLSRHAVRSIPTLLLFHQNRVIAQNAGAMPAERIVQWTKTHAPAG